jgi:AcrR family transcriptional regulator
MTAATTYRVSCGRRPYRLAGCGVSIGSAPAGGAVGKVDEVTRAEATARRRRRDTPTKGDLREQAILDAAEALLETETLDTLTVELIARGAGITRNGLYFYFASKQDVLTALVARTMREVADTAAMAAADVASPPEDTIARAVQATERLWRTHGRVMRAAVEFGAVIPDVGAMWTQTVERYAAAMTEVLRRAGLPKKGPGSAQETARALCWMTERNLYWAYVRAGAGAELTRTARTCTTIWLKVLPS